MPGPLERHLERQLTLLRWRGAIALTLWVTVAAACGDDAVASREQADVASAGAGGDGGALADADRGPDGAAAADDILAEDAGEDGQGGADELGDDAENADVPSDGADVEGGVDGGTEADGAVDDAEVTADVGGTDVGGTDVGGTDVGGTDVGGTDASGADAGAADPCGVCPWNSQPAGPHPGGKGPHNLLEPKKIDYGTAFGDGYKEMLVFEPIVSGPLPVLLFVHGKSLYATGGVIGELGHAYRKLCEHVASHGFVVAFVRVEKGLTDGDHARMAKDLLEAQAKLLSAVSTADPTRIAYAGHSMGGKVVVIAAAEAIVGDKAGKIADPKLVVPIQLSNEKPPLGVYLDAAKKAEELAAGAKVWFTIIGAGDDGIAPVDAAGKPNSQAIYDALKVPTRQLIVLHGTGKDDPNPATIPELVDDHSLALTVQGKVGGLADFATPPSRLDALDWYGTWKLLVGSMDYVLRSGDAKWAFGALRTHGGTLPSGQVVSHEVRAEGWTAVPAP